MYLSYIMLNTTTFAWGQHRAQQRQGVVEEKRGEVYKWKQGLVKEDKRDMMGSFKAEDCVHTGRDAHNDVFFQSSLMVMRHLSWARTDPDQTTGVTLTTHGTPSLKPQTRPATDFQFGWSPTFWLGLPCPLAGPAHPLLAHRQLQVAGESYLVCFLP